MILAIEVIFIIFHLFSWIQHLVVVVMQQPQFFLPISFLGNLSHDDAARTSYIRSMGIGELLTENPNT
jgi:hypothetical protein